MAAFEKGGAKYEEATLDEGAGLVWSTAVFSTATAAGGATARGAASKGTPGTAAKGGGTNPGLSVIPLGTALDLENGIPKAEKEVVVDANGVGALQGSSVG